jgi:hypothetical protein
MVRSRKMGSVGINLVMFLWFHMFTIHLRYCGEMSSWSKPIVHARPRLSPNTRALTQAHIVWIADTVGSVKRPHSRAVLFHIDMALSKVLNCLADLLLAGSTDQLMAGRNGLA